MKYFSLVLATACVAFVSCQDAPEVTIPGLGTLVGTTDKSTTLNRVFNQFRAVPYAAPPLGSLRFQPPAPVVPWSGVLNATNLARKCAQTTVTKRTGDWQSPIHNLFPEEENINGKADDVEDCLYLHIYVPQGAGTNLPVVVYYHGGSFLQGSALIYGPDRFMDEDVILVVPHYRLGPIGFLSLGNDAIPGNAGMLDQVAALQFVKNYISLFGGNPNAITVMGESAGGASSSLLNISPLSSGLFQRFISQSGSAIANWVLDYDPLRGARDLGQLAGCTNPEINALTACFQSIDAMTLLQAFDIFSAEEMKAGRNGYAASVPVVQTAGAVRFLERDPRDILMDGSYVPKPAIMGANKHEGTLVYKMLHDSFLVPNDLLENEEFLSRPFTNVILKFFGIEDQGEAIAAGVEKSFFGFENMGNITNMTPGIIDFMGNMFLKAPTYEAAQINSKVATTYMYSFNYLGDTTLWPFMAGLFAPVPGGVCHANELLLQFKIPSFFLNAEEHTMSETMLKLWANFVKYGDPTPASNPVAGVPTWLPYNDADRNYLRIDKTTTLMKDVTTNEYFIAKDEQFPW